MLCLAFVFIFHLAHASINELTAEERLVCTKGIICTLKKEKLDFFVIGDTGGSTNLGISFDVSNHIKFMGITKPTQTQLAVALSMSVVAQRNPIDFVINVGDNVYWNGVDNVDDYRFQAVFEKPYSDKNLEVPWYMIAGNHDHLGNVTAQIEYTKKSKKWTFPNYFYKAQYAFGKANTLVDIIFIDTIVLCGQTFDVEGRSLFSWITATWLVPEKPEKKYEKLAELQWKWIEDELKKSKADYLFVVGHYPIYTTAERPVKCLQSRLDPLLRKYRVNAYFSGHDHNLQHFYDNGKDSGSEMRYIVSGAGSRIGMWGIRPNPTNIRLQHFYPMIAVPISELGIGLGGFFGFSLGPHNATLKMYGRGFQMMHEATFAPRKK